LLKKVKTSLKELLDMRSTEAFTICDTRQKLVSSEIPVGYTSSPPLRGGDKGEGVE
jgi:hypothetical protein